MFSMGRKREALPGKHIKERTVRDLPPAKRVHFDTYTE